MDTIRVLVIESSSFYRDTLFGGLRSRIDDVQLESATDADEAVLKIRIFNPNVIVLNFFMGIQEIESQHFLDVLSRTTKAPIIAYGMLERTRSRAQAMGVFEYLVKPKPGTDKISFYTDLVKAVKDGYNESKQGNKTIGQSTMVTRDVWNETRKEKPAPVEAPIEAPVSPRPFRVQAPVIKPVSSREGTSIQIIAIGSSTGGTKALSDILPLLKPPLPAIMIAQHIPPVFSTRLAERLDRECALTVKEAEDGDIVKPNTVYIAPGHKHMTIHRAEGRFKIECRAGRPVHGVCPSADVLFHSVAQAAGDIALGVILTGMGCDGAEGMLDMLRCGARTIGQDKASSVVYGMPKAAYDLGAVEEQVPLEKIAAKIEAICRTAG
ncbi:chemotaxis protein CheB [Selenomonas ruminis]|nr:chemotaxis protein CheB [Selenomonas sp. mPRGC5]